MTRIKRTTAASSRLIGKVRFPFSSLRAAGLGGLLSSVSVNSLLASEQSASPMSIFLENQTLFGVSVFLGLVLFATTTSVLHIRSRNEAQNLENNLNAENNELRIKLDRARVFLSAEPQIIIAWGSASGEPDIEGDIALVSDVPIARRVLGFGSWLKPVPAQEMENAVERLRERGEGFRLALISSNGRHLEAEGRAIAGRAILRIRDVSGDRLELTRLRERHAKVTAELTTQRALLDALPQPSWLRDASGKLAWVNVAYARAVEAKDSFETISRGVELLDGTARELARANMAEKKPWTSRLAAVIAGERRAFEVIEVPSASGSAGFAEDLQELENAKADIRRLMEAHSRTLDQLQTAVAIFDGKKRLVFYNAAYRQLWALDPAFLDSNPLDGEVLDRLRAEHRLPEQADFRSWKQTMLAGYQAIEPSSQSWFLPDGRNLRVVSNPNSQGGVTYLYDDVTQAYNLQWRYNALTRRQSETLDTLQEGVAVFGSDGRLSLHNPALAHLWRLDMSVLGENPHIDAFARACMRLMPSPDVWQELRGSITGLSDARVGLKRRLACTNGTVLDCIVAPLPDGATLVTFSDMSASVEVERALVDRNQALVEAESLRNSFVQHVSYELRSPLTSIVGFIAMLGQEMIGPLNPKQREYIGHVTTSADALMAIIDNILDLASIDAGAMELKREQVDVAETIAEAAKGVQDRLAEASLNLQLDVLPNIGTFTGEPKRIRQILFNLLSNAIGFSTSGQTILLSAKREQNAVVFKVQDHGRGIPPEVLDKVFERFSSNSLGSRHRGVGLGLSIVRSFVELHGGRVEIDSAPSRGTIVTCTFPLQENIAPLPAPAETAALPGPDTATKPAATPPDTVPLAKRA